MTAPELLSSDDWCRRAAFLSQRWQTPALHPKAILYRAVEHGLMAKEPAEAANNEAMRLAVERGIDTEQPDLLALAEHIASLAEMLAWVLRGATGPWERPEPLSLPNGATWESGAFLSPVDGALRGILLTSRWDAFRELELKHSWAVAGESSIYNAPITVLVAIIGNMRGGRWHSPFTQAWRHPVAKTLRFQRRDGEEFAQSWERVWREKDHATKEDWLDAMADDGVLAESIQVAQFEVPEVGRLTLAENKLIRIHTAREAPEPQFSQCFDRLRPCPFRACCPHGLEPSEELGFLTSFPAFFFAVRRPLRP